MKTVEVQDGVASAFFSPASVAVVGAGRDNANVGHVILANLIDSFGGRLYPVNPKADLVLGRKCFTDLASLPEAPELTVIAVPAARVPGVMNELAEKGGRCAIIISAGFKETGIEGSRLEAELKEIASRRGMRFLGPNCLGIMDTASGLNASFAGALPARGGIGFMSQSGALCTAILDWAKGENVGFSKFASLGNKADIDEIDMLDAWATDKDTRVVSLYMEGIGDGRAFMEAAARVGRKKPVIAIKAGSTNAGARAVSSHTGSLAGSEAVYRAAFKQCGIVQADTVEQLIDYAVGFANQPLPKGRKLAIVTNAGGPGIMATDACERAGLTLASLAAETVDSLRGELPAAANFYNPIDVLGDAPALRYEAALATVLGDAGVDSVLVLLTPQGLTDIQGTAEVVVRLAGSSGKPVLTCFMGKQEVEKGVRVLRSHGMGNYSFPERAIATLAAMVAYEESRAAVTAPAPALRVRKSVAESVIRGQYGRGFHNIVNLEAAEIAAAYGIAGPTMRLARNLDECEQAAREIGYPVVLKVASPDILHKSDIGGIQVGISGAGELVEAYRTLGRNLEQFMPDATVWGTVVQAMVSGGKEVIVGMNRDPQFGPVMMFGLGGIYVEVLKDVSFRVAPLGPVEALKMVREIRSYPLLRGVRGEARADMDALVEVICRLSQLATDFPDITEIEINPLMVLPVGQGCLAADVRVLLRHEEEKR